MLSMAWQNSQGCLQFVSQNRSVQKQANSIFHIPSQQQSIYLSITFVSIFCSVLQPFHLLHCCVSNILCEYLDLFFFEVTFFHYMQHYHPQFLQAGLMCIYLNFLCCMSIQWCIYLLYCQPNKIMA